MATRAVSSISPRELANRVNQGESVNLIDVRTPVEYQEVHVPFARNVPLDRLDPVEVLAGHKQDEPLYVICRSGSRASKACDAITAAGFENVVNVEGGTQAWDAAGLAVQRGKAAMSLERQVRIAAGSIVLIGAVLGYFVNVNLIWLSAFVGGGLVFSGITDTCGMGMLLARMPWNQVKTPDSSQQCDTDTSASAGCCG